MPSLGSRMTRTGADIIGIEDIGVVRVIGRVAGTMLTKKELLPEPSNMRAVPFRGARVRHRLHKLIFRRQRCRAPLGLVANRPVCGEQPFRQLVAGLGGISGGGRGERIGQRS